MKQGSNSRRPRGRNNNKRQSRNSNFDSSGPEGRVRGNARQVYEKYLTMAGDASMTGDRIASENYYQHAEHYFRIVNAQAATEAEKDGQKDGQKENNNNRNRRNNTVNNNNNRPQQQGDGDDRQAADADSQPFQGQGEQPATPEPAPTQEPEKTTEQLIVEEISSDSEAAELNTETETKDSEIPDSEKATA